MASFFGAARYMISPLLLSDFSWLLYKRPRRLISAFAVRSKNYWRLQSVSVESKFPEETLCMLEMNLTLCILCIPADTWRFYNVVSTSMQRHDVASTLRRRCTDVMCLLGCSWAHIMTIYIFIYYITQKYITSHHIHRSCNCHLSLLFVLPFLYFPLH